MCVLYIKEGGRGGVQAFRHNSVHACMYVRTKAVHLVLALQAVVVQRVEAMVSGVT